MLCYLSLSSICGFFNFLFFIVCKLAILFTQGLSAEYCKCSTMKAEKCLVQTMDEVIIISYISISGQIEND